MKGEGGAGEVILVEGGTVVLWCQVKATVAPSVSPVVHLSIVHLSVVGFASASHLRSTKGTTGAARRRMKSTKKNEEGRKKEGQRKKEEGKIDSPGHFLSEVRAVASHEREAESPASRSCLETVGVSERTFFFSRSCSVSNISREGRSV